jgi:hypothetical protein
VPCRIPNGVFERDREDLGFLPDHLSDVPGTLVRHPGHEPFYSIDKAFKVKPRIEHVDVCGQGAVEIDHLWFYADELVGTDRERELVFVEIHQGRGRGQ